MTNYTILSDSPLSGWYGYLYTPLANPFVASEETFLPQNLYEFLPAFTPPNLEYPCGPLLETPSGTPSTEGVPPNSPSDVPSPSTHPLQIAAIWSASASLSPPPQTPTFPPPNWYKIPQKVYNHGRKQWNFVALESISFGVSGRPGVNLGHALRKSFAGLDARDELVLRNAGSAISCRFLFPGYPPKTSYQIATTHYNKDRDPIDRSRLAYLVARKLKSYLDAMAQKPYSISEPTPKRWKIGEGFMRLENMFLVRLDSVSKGSWQPEIWVMDPTM